MQIKKRHVAMARAAGKIMTRTRSRSLAHFKAIEQCFDSVIRWHRAAKGKLR